MLAITAGKRSPAVPDIPTVAEQGYPGFAEISWIAFFGPTRLPTTLVNRLNTEINQVLVQPDVNKALVELGMEVTPWAPATLAEYVKSELVKWSEVVKFAGIKAE